jgi:hypothetical protein
MKKIFVDRVAMEREKERKRKLIRLLRREEFRRYRAHCE